MLYATEIYIHHQDGTVYKCLPQSIEISSSYGEFSRLSAESVVVDCDFGWKEGNVLQEVSMSQLIEELKRRIATKENQKKEKQ